MDAKKNDTVPGFAEGQGVFDPASAPDDDLPDMSMPYWQEVIDKTPVQYGRPKALNPKVQVTIRLDADVVEVFKADGPGWQTRINAALRKAAGL
jgi:uncharacterized protein (DUF4415 family)